MAERHSIPSSMGGKALKPDTKLNLPHNLLQQTFHGLLICIIFAQAEISCVLTFQLNASVELQQAATALMEMSNLKPNYGF